MRVARDIKPLVADPSALANMQDEAARIVAARKGEGVRLSGPETAKRLVQATIQLTNKTAFEKEMKSKAGEVILRYTKSRAGALTIKLPSKATVSKGEVLKAIESLLSQ